MATHAATRNLSGLARALAQHGLMPETEAESLQNQAQAANISFVEQVLTSKRFTPNQVAVFGSRAFGVPLLDLSSFDFDQFQKEFFDAKMSQSRRVLPLAKRGNRLFVAVSDPANMQALEEVRFKTNLVVEPVVVEDDKLGHAIHRLVEASGIELKRGGKDMLGRCPFHEDDTASLVVTPGKNLWHCFGCGVGGGPIDWVMKRRGVSFRHAVELLREGVADEVPWA